MQAPAAAGLVHKLLSPGGVSGRLYGLYLHHQPRGGVNLPGRGVRLQTTTPKAHIETHVCVPLEGYKVASLTPVQVALSAAGYCPREGYKVASAGFLSTLPARGAVTVPVRGIRLHPRRTDTQNHTFVTVPVRGIRLHPTAGLSGWSSTSYCPREGYKVASAKVHKCKPVTLVRMMQLRK